MNRLGFWISVCQLMQHIDPDWTLLVCLFTCIFGSVATHSESPTALLCSTHPIVGLMLWSKWSWTKRQTMLDFPTPVSWGRDHGKRHLSELMKQPSVGSRDSIRFRHRYFLQGNATLYPRNSTWELPGFIFPLLKKECLFIVLSLWDTFAYTKYIPTYE